MAQAVHPIIHSFGIPGPVGPVGIPGIPGKSEIKTKLGNTKLPKGFDRLYDVVFSEDFIVNFKEKYDSELKFLKISKQDDKTTLLVISDKLAQLIYEHIIILNRENKLNELWEK